jgi:hypothetical protein
MKFTFATEPNGGRSNSSPVPSNFDGSGSYSRFIEY